MHNRNYWCAVRTPDGQFKTSIDNTGYILVDVDFDGRVELHYLHDVIAGQFLGPRPHGGVVRHHNGNILDNRPENLVYVTPDPATAPKTGRRMSVEACRCDSPDPCDCWDLGEDWEPGELVEPETVMGSDGFLWVNQGLGGEYWVRRHDLMAEVFNGPTPEGMEVYHLDGDVTNNVLANLGYRPAASSGR